MSVVVPSSFMQNDPPMPLGWQSAAKAGTASDASNNSGKPIFFILISMRNVARQMLSTIEKDRTGEGDKTV
ncbi:hypothetical protein BN1007_71132 [Klebsiella variicola]|nr:hypothetical protein KVR801_160013 [Klebsiella variicola]CTQ17847.1 hypothetical protein BN1007_71132 [Klebsiella variicola]